MDETYYTENVMMQYLEEVYRYVKTVHGQNKITAVNIVTVASELIQIVEKYKQMTGAQKKMVIISSIKRIVNEQEDTIEEKAALNIIIDNTLPILIDSMVSAINGAMKFIKENKGSIIKKLKSIFCCK